jgi:putative peptidoglycan lipid II flippase
MATDTIKATSIATSAHLIGRAANVVLPLAVIAVFGADVHTDRFFWVMALGFFCYGTMANAIAEATVPLLISENQYLPPSTILKYSAAISLCILLVGSLWHGLTGSLSPVYASALALMTGAGIANGFFTGILHAQERYTPAGLSWSLRFIPLMVLMVLRPSHTLLPWLAFGIGLMDWTRCFVLIRCRKPGRSDAVAIDLKSFVIRYRSTYLTVMTAMVIMGANPLVDRWIAQINGPGGISILDAAERIYGILGALCTLGLMTVLLTRLSRAAANGHLDHDWSDVLKTVALWCLVWMIVGALSGYWMLDWWLAGATALTAAQCVDVKQAYWFYLAGLPLFTIGVVYTKRLQALRRTGILVWISILAVVLNLAASLALRRIMGIPGIALATTLVYTATAMVLAMIAHRTAINRSDAPHDGTRPDDNL